MFGRSAKRERAAKRAYEQLFDGLRRGVDLPPTAAQERFPTGTDIANNPDLRFDLNNREGKIFLGTVGARILERHGKRYAADGTLVGIADDRSVLCCAGNRSGKGRAFLINNLHLWPYSIICSDPKLDLASDTASYRARTQKVYLIDPFEVAHLSASMYRASFNPLKMRLGDDADSAIELAMLIADALVVKAGDRDPHWNATAQEMIEATVLHVMTWPAYENCRTLRTVYELLMTKVEDGGPGEPSTLEVEMVGNMIFDGVVAAGATAFFDKDDRERSSVLSTIRRHLHFLTYPKIARALDDGPVDLMKAIDEPTTIYFGVPATKARTCAAFSRLFVNLSLAAFEANTNRRDYQYQRGRAPTLMMIDEFHSLGYMERIEVAAGQIAGLGCKLMPVFQDLSQIKTIYPNSWETFLGNAGTLIFFGNNDLTTLEWIEKRLGSTLVYNPSHNDPTYDSTVSGGATGSGFNLGSHPLMTVPEIARIFGREDPFQRQLVITPTGGPMIIQKAFYDLHHELRRHYDRQS